MECISEEEQGEGLRLDAHLVVSNILRLFAPSALHYSSEDTGPPFDPISATSRRERHLLHGVAYTEFSSIHPIIRRVLPSYLLQFSCTMHGPEHNSGLSRVDRMSSSRGHSEKGNDLPIFSCQPHRTLLG